MAKRVLVGMSGGIDSSAVCMMLLEQGYEVVGATMRVHDIPSQFENGNDEPTHVLEARALAEKLGIPHYTVDLREEFRGNVIANFLNEYLAGHTPNPCVMCNLYFKWRFLLETAEKYECDFVATGHYAQIENKDGIFMLKKGVDSRKDQSYFLWRLGQKELAKTLFPLGGMTKDVIKDYVLSKGFEEKVKKKESMEVCFIDGDYRDFIKEQIPDIDDKVGKGCFVDNMGKKLGEHNGFPFYTIGQRKGLGIALGKPAFVVNINAKKNTIRLGFQEELLDDTVILKDCNLIDENIIKDYNSENSDNKPLTIKIRYRSKDLTVKNIEIKDKCLYIKLTEKASAITPGQSGVIYNDDTIVAGGIITDKREIRKLKNKE